MDIIYSYAIRVDFEIEVAFKELGCSFTLTDVIKTLRGVECGVDHTEGKKIFLERMMHCRETCVGG